MRTSIPFLLSFIAVNAFAQCPHDPTITPADLILCPNETATLSTQEADSYQWLKDGMPIPGAVQQTHAVNYGDDGGSVFSVIATVNGCSEASPGVLVDGWAFLLPYVISSGDEPAMIGSNGESYYCHGAFIELVAGGVNANIQWTQDGVPIPGATGQSLVVTENGYYSMSGAPGVCPDFIMPLGVQIPVLFLEEQPPAIVQSGDQLCYAPVGASHQWYLNGAPFDAPACFTPTSSGEYLVEAVYQCGPIASEPFDLALGIADAAPARLTIAPNPAVDATLIRSPAALTGSWRLVDATGRAVLQGRFPGCTDCAIGLADVGPGAYLLLTEEAAPLRLLVKR